MDCYEILQVNHDSDLQEIKANYRYENLFST